MLKTLLLRQRAARPTTGRPWQLALLLALLLGPLGGWAQTLTNYVLSPSAGTFTALSGGTTPTFVGASTDDDYSNGLPIGFPFAYMGTTYTTVSVSTNGWLSLGGTLSSSVPANALASSGVRPVIAPLWDDLDIVAATNFSYRTTGSVGSRVFTAEWKATKWFYNTTSLVSFQAKVYEATGAVQFVYSPDNATATGGSASAGITSTATGSGNYLSLNSLGTAPTVSSTAETTTISAKPVAGQTYTFTAPAPAAPTTLTFSNVAATSMTVNFVDNSTTENNFQVVFSTDPTFATFSLGIVTSTTKAATGGAYTANLTGLSASTTYYVRISSVAEVNSLPLTGSQATLAGFTFGPGPYTIDNTTATNNTTGGTNFASFTDAINALNTGTVSGPLTFNVAAGQTFAEVPPALTKSGSSGNLITFRKNPAGTGNPTIKPALNSGTGTADYIVGLFGADYIVFDGINLDDTNSAGGTTAGQREYGYFLGTSTTTNGAQNNAIQNCTITLNGGTSTTPNLNSVGIFVSGNAQVAANAVAAPNANNKINGNTIVGPVTGIYLASTSTTVAANQDFGNEVGSTAGNTITARASGSTASYGVRVDYQNGVKVENNTVTMAGGSTGTMRGVGVGASSGSGINGAVLINNNTITLTPAGAPSTAWGINQVGSSTPASVAITNNKVQNSVLTGTSGNVTYIEDAYSATGATNISTITGNQVLGNAAATTGVVSGIYRSGSGGTANINANYIGVTAGGVAAGNTLTGASATLYGIRATTGTITVNGNFIQNNALTNTSGTTSSVLYGYYNVGSPLSETITNNTITNLTLGGASTATANVLAGILTSTTAAAVKALNGNTIGALTIGTSGGAMTGAITGISQSLGTTIGVSQNKIYDLTAYGASGAVTGILLNSGTTFNVANNLVGNFAAPASTSATALTGINVASTTASAAANVYFNTVYLNGTGATNFGTSGIYLSSTSAVLDARNNLVVNKATASGTGSAVALRRATGTAGTAPANLASTTNNNLYFAGAPSATSLIYAEGTTTLINAKQTLADYKAFVAARESSSITEDVPFLSTSGGGATFLHIDPNTSTKVESAGQAISGITTDYDGQTRNSTPDIGADEGTFTPIQGVDAQLASIDGPTTPFAPGSQPVVVTIRNAGTATITSAIVELFVNTVSQGTTTYTGSLAAGASAQVTLSSFNFQVGAPYTVTTTITNVNNGATETDLTNNSRTTTIAPALCGNYNVGAGQTFATLDAAVAALNQGGATCAVTFTLTDATYAATAGITINQFIGNNATNTLTIKPAVGVQPALATTAAATFLLQLNGADYVTIDGSNTNNGTTRDLTLTSANTTAGSAVVYVASLGTGAGATFNTVKNLNIVGGSPTVSTAFGVYAAGTTLSTTGTGADNDNLTVQNNAITTAYAAIYARGVVSTGLLDNLLIAGNQIGSATAAATVTSRGVDVQSAVAPIIRQNRIEGMTTSASLSIAAIDLGTTVTNALVSRNNITNLRSLSASGYGAYGINISSATGTSGIEISNNMISDVLTYGDATGTTFNPFGIRITGGTGHKVYYNSVSMTGSMVDAAADGGTSAALLVTAGTGLDVRNNVFFNSQTGETDTKAYALYAASGVTFTTINYNDYFVSGTNGVLATLNGGTTDRTDIAAVRTATTQDAASISADPQFTSTSNLHTIATVLDAKATPIGTVTVDFDGDARNASTPDIGADEFTPPATLDLKPVALVAPVAGSICYSNAEPITVQVQGNGGSTIDFAQTNGTVTVVVTPPSGAANNQTFTTTLASGTLAPGATQNVTLPGTLNMTAVGTYSFVVSASVPGDVNTADNLTATRTTTAPQAALPYLEQFNTSATPANFTLSGFTTSTSANNGGPTGSYGLRVNIYSSVTTASATTPILGNTVSGNNVLTFDARFTNFSGTTPATVLQAGDKLDVQVATCGGAFTTVYTINNTNQNGTGAASTSFYTYSVPLTGVTAGQKVQVRFIATYGGTTGSDFYVDLDNLNVQSLVNTDLSPTALLAPSATQGCYGPAETVTVTVKNTGAATLDFAANPATVTVNVTGAATATLTGSIGTGTLAAGASQNVTLTPTLNMSTAGTYTFAISATVTGDQNTANDLLTPSPTRTVAAPVAGTIAPASTTLCNSGTVTLTLTGSANGSIQYQTSPDNVTFTNVASGGTTATYTTPVLTQTTYFRAQTTCGANVVTSNVATVTVNTPLIAATNSPQTICAGSTATVTANGSSGTTVRFFAASTGGTAVATGTAGAATASYTTPALTANTTYYAEAFTGGTESVGKTTTAVSDGGYQGTAGLVFTTTGPTTIKSVTVYNATATAGSMAVALINNTSGAVITTSATFAVPAGSTTALIPTVLNVNINVPAAGTYRLMTASSPTPPTLYRGSTGTTFPYTSPSGAVSITSGYFSGTSSTYYFFYNWQVSSECASATRTPVQVNVDPLPAFTTTQTNVSCFGANAGSITVNATAGTGTYEYSNDGGGSYQASNVFSGLAAGTYPVQVRNLGGAQCAAPAQPVTITQPASALAVTATKTDETAPGANDGTVTATATGGTSPYQYSLNNGAPQPSNTFVGLAPGSYAVTVSDAGGCTITSATVTVGAAAACTLDTWNGSVSTDWFTAANWSCGQVPTATTDALIPAGVPNYPSLATPATAIVRSLTLASGAGLAQSAGVLEVYGDLTNNTPAANVALTGGAVRFVGAAAQNLNGAEPLRFFNLTVNKSSDTLHLATNQTVTGTLALASGILKTYVLSSRRSISLPGTITETATSFVLGDVEVPAANLGTDGASSSFGGLGLTLTVHATRPNGRAANLPGLTTVMRSTGTPVYGATPTTGPNAGTVSRSIRRQYTITPAPGQDTNLSVDMVFGYNDSPFELNGIAESNLRLFSAPASSGPFRPNGGLPNTAANTVSRDTLDHLSVWTLGNLAAPLPVELTAFVAERQGLDARLTWTTAREKNNAGFEVQVSANGHDFRKLGFVASAAATSTTPRQYAFLDAEKGKAGLRYYRLRQLDLSGAAEFSPVRTVRFTTDGGAALRLAAAPNPFRQQLQLLVTLPAGTAAAPAQLRLTDAAGRLVLALRTPPLAAGESPLAPLDLHELASGVYFVQLAFPGQPAQYLKVVKE